nr:hypothetical protein GCM10020093_058630 [Planobispora longispora]
MYRVFERPPSQARSVSHGFSASRVRRLSLIFHSSQDFAGPLALASYSRNPLGSPASAPTAVAPPRTSSAAVPSATAAFTTFMGSSLIFRISPTDDQTPCRGGRFAPAITIPTIPLTGRISAFMM